MDLKRENLELYLRSILGEDLELLGFRKIGETLSLNEDVKGFGYGSPLLLEYIRQGSKESAVISTMRVQHGFGHDHFSDRAKVLIWQNSVFNKLPKHVHSIDVGYFTELGHLVSTGAAKEYFLLMETIGGREYFYDLERVKEHGTTNLDYDRVIALSNYLAEIHSFKKDCPPLYKRKVREIIGDGECIFGILDDYPDNPRFLNRDELCDIEKLCVEWRWKLRPKVHRLCQVHGDFHPWNIMFREGSDFSVLDRSRGEFGEPADDITAITMNYIFYSIQKNMLLTGGLKDLFELFFDNYLEKTGDEELLEVVAPFFAFRTVVVASPTWYPLLSIETRRALFNFLENVLKEERFDYRNVNSYIA
ncbi:MAG: aminoglycoside phosphotransferase family protein [Methanotrichaceae archaeon]|nr:aminoglycoside phosphotransferase family protein [Methanotrichaceae archaeon]